MRHQGLLGAPRLTSVGPLVHSNTSVSKELDGDRADAIVRGIAEENGISRNNISDEEFDLIVREMSEEIYEDDDPVAEAKRFRFIRCMNNQWVVQWVGGISESDNTEIQFDDELDVISMMARGCVGMTESNVADNEAIIPQVFKRD